ncbi:hypothetical protein ACU8OG_08345 [Rhizobium leguminosarum]
MGLIYKNFDGVPMIGVSMGDRFEHASLEHEEWELDHAVSDDEDEISDLCTLISEGGADRHRERSKNMMFEAAPRMDVFERLLADTAKECAQEEGLSVRGLFTREVRGDAAVVRFYNRLRHDWQLATLEEGLDVACPSRRVFVHAVVAELRDKSRPVRRG